MNLTWAVNQSKVNRALADVREQAKTDSKVVVDEDTVKARYIALGGLVQEGSVVAKKVVAKKGGKKVADDVDADDEDDKDAE